MAINSVPDTEKQTRIDLLRHGETTAGRCLLGSTDALLSDSGWQQMHAAVKNKNYQRIISSPLKRCAEFSKQLSKENNLPLSIEDDLREIHFGDWEAKPINEIWESQQVLLSAFWDDPVNNAPPNAERLIDFEVRVNVAFNKIKNDYKGDNILMIIHGGVIRQILSNILSVPFKTAQQFNIDYASTSRLNCFDESINIEFINQQITLS